MSNWSGGVLTNVGRELQLKVEAGATLTFTKIKLGDGIESLEAVEDLTDLMSSKFVMGISSKSVANDVCKITGVLSSSSIATGFRAREWGLFAQDPDIGEILYMISIDTQPDWVPSGSDIGKLAVSYAMNVAVSNASSITARIDPAGLVTADMLAELIHETQYNKYYNVGDYAFTGYGLPAWAYLECIQEGTSGTIELDLSNVVEGERVNDGTVIWIVRNWHSIHQYLVEATGYGIVSGLQVKAQSTPNMTVSIEGGTVHMKNGTRVMLAAIAALSIATADATNPRIDSIYVDGTGSVAYAQGTPAESPVTPTLSSDAIKLADVNVAANQTSVTSTDIAKNGEVKACYQNTGIVNVKDFGAVGDGVHDDTAAIQALINAVDNVTIYFPHGKYLISDTLRTKQDGSQSLSFKLDDNAEVITNSALNPMVELNGTATIQQTFSGGKINGNGKALSGLFLRNYNRPLIYNVKIFDCIDKHMIVGDNFVHHNIAANISNIQVFTTVANTQSYGIYHRGGDSYIDSCRLFGVKTGIFSDTSIFASRIHTCLANDAYDGSVAFDINVGGGISSLTECYADGYETSYKLAGRVSINHCMTYMWEKKEDYELGVYAKPTIIDIGSYNNPSTILDINGLRVHSYDGIPVRLLDRLPASAYFGLNTQTSQL